MNYFLQFLKFIDVLCLQHLLVVASIHNWSSLYAPSLYDFKKSWFQSSLKFFVLHPLYLVLSIFEVLKCFLHPSCLYRIQVFKIEVHWSSLFALFLCGYMYLELIIFKILCSHHLYVVSWNWNSFKFNIVAFFWLWVFRVEVFWSYLFALFFIWF